jgi:choline dehydrogenase-like flavoprotein
MSELSTQEHPDPEFARGVEENQLRLRGALQSTYDFIVCGSGSSGAVVARRLAENSDVSVLLIEAGGSDSVPEVEMAAAWPLNLGSARDWGFRALPNPHLNGRAIPMSTGKVLGGGSSINVMLWARGHKSDESYRRLLKDNKIDELRVKLTEGLDPDGFMIHFVAEQGDLLALEGRRQQGNVYYLGDVVAAAQMTKLNFSAALYAPLRLNVYENAHGGTTFEYDKPSTQFGQFHNADIDKVAQTLDDHLLGLIKKVST